MFLRKRYQRPLLILCSALAILSGMTMAILPASSARAAVTVSATVGQEIVLNLSASAIDFGAVTPSGSPYVKNSAVTATVYANVPWSLGHSATNLIRLNGTESLPGLEYQADATGGFATIPVGSTSVKTGAPTPGTPTVFDYKLTVPWTGTPPGTYTGTVTYVAVAQ